MTIQELKDLVRLKIAGQGTMVDAGGALPPVLNGILDTLAATQNVESVVVTVDGSEGTPSADATFADGVLTLAFHNLKGEKGDQGNTGSSVDYPFELVNNVTTDDATKALSAAQGVVLDNKISQLGQEVDDLIQDADTDDDFDMADEQGNIIVKFRNKEIETRNFNSALAPQEGDAEQTLDYAVTDPNGKNIFGVQAGYPVTKHFDGAIIKGMALEHEAEIESLNTRTPGIDETYGWESIDPTNPLKKIRFDAGLTPVIRRWGFIGDSLSSGCHGYDTGVGTATGEDIYDYSWGQFICRLCGSEGYNFSYGGASAKSWLTNSSRGWPVAQLEENHKQAYTIALGINDSANMSSIYPDGLGDSDTDLVVNPSNPYDYSNNNEDTYVGCYGGIIQRIRSVNPRCRIFILTMLDKNANNPGHLAMDSEIRKIASKFEDVYVIDLALYAPQYYGSPLYDNLVYWSHLTSVGYVWLAYVINTYIDWIIRTNLYSFRDIAFIGTDKYMNQNL